MISDGPFLWYLNRSTGLVLLALFTLTMLFGILSTKPRGRVPRFAIHHLHRNLALLGMVLLGVHVASAVIDEYVDIRWWQAFVPLHLHYRPLPLALGIVCLDVLVAIVVTSLLRHRIGARLWRVVHLSSYPVWGVAVLHGLQIGTDSEARWGQAFYLVSAALVAVAVLWRLTFGMRVRRRAVAE